MDGLGVEFQPANHEQQIQLFRQGAILGTRQLPEYQDERTRGNCLKMSNQFVAYSYLFSVSSSNSSLLCGLNRAAAASATPSDATGRPSA
jgi:hypothetical protein